MLTIRQFEDGGGWTMLMLGGLVGWILVFLYEGPVLYAMASARNIDGVLLNAGNLFFLAMGLLGGMVIRFPSFAWLRGFLAAILGTCLALSLLVSLLPGTLWYVVFPVLSLAAGLCMSLWGHLLKAFVPKSKRLLTVPVVMLSACTVLTVSHILATQISAYTGYAIAELSLASAIFCLWQLRTPQRNLEQTQLDSPRYILRHYGALLCFILCITLNAGFMFQSVYPLFAQHETLLSFYINIPYMGAIAFLSIFRSSNRVQTLYIALALWGIAVFN